MKKNYFRMAPTAVLFAACVLLALAQQGLEFLQQVRMAFPEGSSLHHQLGNRETLRRLEQFSPGFSAWAASLATRPRK
jgi:hypothetical protein